MEHIPAVFSLRIKKMKNNLIKQEKNNRKTNLTTSMYKWALQIKLKQYKKLQSQLPEIEYKLNNPIGWYSDNLVNKTGLLLNRMKSQKTTPSKRDLARLLSYRKQLRNIVANKLGNQFLLASRLITQVDLYIGK